MRAIGPLGDEPQAKLFSANLLRKKIENTVDGKTIWVHSEDRIEEASQLLALFQTNPLDPQFTVSLIELTQEPEEVPEAEVMEQIDSSEIAELLNPRRTGHLTAFFIAFCSLIYLLGAMQEIAFVEKGVPVTAFIPTPIQMAMLFDVPAPVENLEKAVADYTPPPAEKPAHLSAEILAKIHAVDKTPFWRGYGEMALLKIKGLNPDLAKGPLFGKIREGEFWRLFSPVFLHGSILHILFNMLWLWVLGKQIEERIGAWKYLLLTVVIGVGSNLVQYLASGPFFLGYSGVIMGLAGFIWSREKIACWEGYPLQRSMILFLALFVMAMFALQLLSFFLLYFSLLNFEPNIANSAHIGGAVIGAILGRLSFFSARSYS